MHFGIDTLLLDMIGQYEYAEAFGLRPSYSKAACNGPQEKLNRKSVSTEHEIFSRVENPYLVKHGVFAVAVLLSNPNKHQDSAYRRLYIAHCRSDCFCAVS